MLIKDSLWEKVLDSWRNGYKLPTKFYFYMAFLEIVGSLLLLCSAKSGQTSQSLLSKFYNYIYSDVGLNIVLVIALIFAFLLFILPNSENVSSSIKERLKKTKVQKIIGWIRKNKCFQAIIRWIRRKKFTQAFIQIIRKIINFFKTRVQKIRKNKHFQAIIQVLYKSTYYLAFVIVFYFTILFTLPGYLNLISSMTNTAPLFIMIGYNYNMLCYINLSFGGVALIMSCIQFRNPSIDKNIELDKNALNSGCLKKVSDIDYYFDSKYVGNTTFYKLRWVGNINRKKVDCLDFIIKNPILIFYYICMCITYVIILGLCYLNFPILQIILFWKFLISVFLVLIIFTIVKNLKNSVILVKKYKFKIIISAPSYEELLRREKFIKPFDKNVLP